MAENGRLVAEDQFPHGLQHAAEIIVRIDRLCRDQGWHARDLQELYVSAGPGSFTGLRIGVTLAKTLALVTGAKIVAVPTMSVLTHNAPTEALHLILVLDAKRDQVFTARFTRVRDQWVVVEPAHLDNLESTLDRAPRPVHLLGEGIPYHRKFVAPEDSSVIVTPPELWRPRAAAVVEEGIRLASEGRFIDPDDFSPIYIRKPEAQEKWEQSQGANG